MKHTVSRVPRGSGVEFMQAIATLMALSGIYLFSTTYGSSSVAFTDVPVKPAMVTSNYWNDKIGYGFTSFPGDTYAKKGSGSVEQVEIRPGDGIVYDKDSIRVSFYSTLSIQEIESQNTGKNPRSYSRLPNGIAMIEGDLSSDRAKTILATLHSR